MKDHRKSYVNVEIVVCLLRSMISLVRKNMRNARLSILPEVPKSIQEVP